MKMIKVNSIEQLEEKGFIVSDQEKEIIKMAFNQNQKVYQDEVGGTTLTVVVGEDEFLLTTISK